MSECEELLLNSLLCAETILDRIDEYQLYCFYLKQQVPIGKKIHSPIREEGDQDDSESWSLFYSNYPDREFHWKDHAKNITGDIFKMLRMRFDLRNNEEVYKMIDSDFNLGFGNSLTGLTPALPDYKRVDPLPIHIRVKSREFRYEDIRFWQQFNVDRKLLDLYNIKPLEYYWLVEEQEHPQTPRGLGYSYRIRSKYKLYMPYAPKSQKFRNNYTQLHLEGFEQLEFSQRDLVITKSTKDIACLRSFGYEAISPRSETTMIYDKYLKLLEKKYRNVLVLFDNDGKHNGDLYPYDKVFVPEETGCKDISDFCKMYGPNMTANLLKQLIR